MRDPVRYPDRMLWLDEHDRRHREDGPAVVYFSGTEIWYIHGVRHRADGPAFRGSDGTEQWYFKGLVHRADGPAIIHPNGRQEWWLSGHRFTNFHTWLLSNDVSDAQKMELTIIWA